MDSSKSSCLNDDQIQDLVARLQEDVRERNSQLGTLQREVEAIRDQIQEKNKDREKFMSNLHHMDEVDEVVAKHKQLERLLQCKQAQLLSLQDGSATEKRELEEVRQDLQQIRNDQLQVVSQRQQNTLCIKELKREYEETQKMGAETQPQLEKVKREVDARRNELAQNQKPTKPSKQPLSVRLDRFIMKSCRQAGLQL